MIESLLISSIESRFGEQNEVLNLKIENLESRVSWLEAVASKKIWKIVISFAAGVSLLLNI